MKRAGIVATVAVGLLAALELWRYQSATGHFVSRDGYYHARYANLLPSRGLSREFAWMQQSFWKDRFADKELLFHVALAPFEGNEARMVARGKFAAWLFGVLALAAFAVGLHVTGIRAPAVGVFLFASAGAPFLYRLLELRPHVLSIVFFISGTALLLTGRYRWLIPLGFLYSWSYSAPHFLVLVAAAHAAGVWLHEGKREWRGVAWAAAGVAAGMLIHPYFPNNLRLWWVQNVVVLAEAWGRGTDPGVWMGNEFRSVHPRALVVGSAVVYLSLLAGSIASVVAARAGKISSRTTALLVLTWACFTLYALSARFIEYLAPAALWLALSVATDLLQGTSTFRPRALAAAAALAVALLFLHYKSATDTLAEVRKVDGPVLAGCARWTRAHVPPGQNVLHLHWGDFVQLFHVDPDHRYVVGLDPSFMMTREPGKLRMLEDIRTGRRPVVAAELREAFAADFLVVSHESPRLVRACEDALLETEFEDDGGVVYRLK